MKKLGIIGGGLILSAALMVSNAGAVLASGSEAAPVMAVAAQGGQDYQGIFGTVTGIGDNTITLNSKSLGDGVVILLDEGDEGTIYKVPAEGEVSWEYFSSKIEEDVSRLAIRGILDGEDYKADQIMLIPDGATYRHMSGVVVATQARTMTMMNSSGETWQVNLPEGVQGGAVGDLVSVAVQNSAGEGPYEASGIQTAAMVQERIMNQINELSGQGAGTQAQVQSREQVMERLGEQLEGLAERHMQILNDVLEKAPLEAKESIQAKITTQEQLQLQIHQASNEANSGTGE